MTTQPAALPPIECMGVTIAFGSHTVIRDLSLAVQPGEFVALGGDSGTGKSTLLQAIMGFTPLQAGEVRIMGQPLNPATVWQLRRHIAYVPQEAQVGNGMKTEAFLQRPFSYKANAGQRYDAKVARELFDCFRLPQRLFTSPLHSLSGGEKQRIAIIGAILLNRPLYLLDEITSALDEDSTRAVTDWFAGQTDATILAVAHDAVFREAARRIVPLRVNGDQP